MVRLSFPFIVFLSFVSTALTIANAFFLKKQFYPSVIYLTKSNTSMAVIYFQGAILSYLVFSLMRWIFFGQLRVAEIEHAQERVWHAIMETCLTFTVFRDDFSPKFVIQFVILFFAKAFHWLTEDRVDFMERSPVITVLFHARIMGVLSLLSAIDSYFISHAFFTTLFQGASAQLVFGFEYAVLLTMIAHITIKYILHMHDLRSAHPWENKAVYMLYAELFANFLRCVIYMIFAVVMIKLYTFPLFAIRPFYLTIRALQKAINDVIQSRRAINAMNNLFPLATTQELIEGDNTCIICREEMTVESSAKKLPCNHIFHPNCLRSWFQRQQTCPTCRTDVLAQRRSNTIISGLAQNAQNNLFNPPAPQNNIFGMQFPQQNLFFGQNLPQQNTNTSNQTLNSTQNNSQTLLHPNNLNPFSFFGMPSVFPFPFNPMSLPPFMFNPNIHRFQIPSPLQNNQFTTTNASASENVTNTSELKTDHKEQPSTSKTNNENTSNTENTTGSENSNYTTTNNTSFNWQPPFNLIPPFSFPSPPTFSGFSDAEIAEMEGRERLSVEARVQALQNISVLLDAAVLQFQQYLSIATALNSSKCDIFQPSTSTSNDVIDNSKNAENT